MSTIPASKASSAASWEKSSTSSKSKAGAVSVRRETLQIARLAPKLLGESADLVAQFIRRRLNPDGAFSNRAGDSDLYYTVFRLQALLLLRVHLPGESATAY